MPCFSPLVGMQHKRTGGLCFRHDESNGNKMEVACGQCLGCRLDRSRMWAVRIIHECSLHEDDAGNCFITLTYDDEHVPADWSLRKSDFQKFMKRIRKAHEQRIRFFHVGEYGNRCKHFPYVEEVKSCVYCNVGRPHYHGILFNCDFADKEIIGSHNGVIHYTSKRLQSFWPNGYVQIGEANFQSAAYIARYCLKKVTGVQADDHYYNVDEDGVAVFVEPEYCTMSRRPGIGFDFYKKFETDIFPSDEVPVPGVGVLKKVPRYYSEFLRSEDEGLHEEVKKLRRVFRSEHRSEYTPERLEARYRVKLAQRDQLRRAM